MLIPFLAFLLILVINGNAIAETQDSTNSNTVSELTQNDPNAHKMSSNNSALNSQLLRDTGPDNDTVTKPAQETQMGNITYTGPRTKSRFSMPQRLKRNIRSMHRGGRQIGRNNYRRAQSSTKWQRDKHRMYRGKGRTAMPSKLRNGKLYPRYATNYEYAPQKHHRKNTRYSDKRRARRLIRNRNNNFLRRQMHEKIEGEESKNTENTRNNDVVSAENNSERKKNFKRKQNRGNNQLAKTSNQGKTKANRRKFQSQISNKNRKSNVNHNFGVNKNEENPKINATQILKTDNAESRNTVEANSKDAQGDDQKSVDVNKEETLNKKRKEKAELKDITEKWIEISNGTKVLMQNKKEKKESIIKPKQKKKGVENYKRKSLEDSSVERRHKENENKTSKQKNTSYSTKVKENKLASANAKRDTGIATKQTEVEQLKNIVNKAIDISSVNKPVVQGKSEKDKSVTTLQKNTTTINETREGKKKKPVKDTKDTKNQDKTPKEKRKGYNASASKSKSDKNEDRIPLNVNAAKTSSTPIQRKEGKQLKSAINKTINISNVNDPIIHSNSGKDETKENKKEKTPKDSKNTKIANKPPKQKKNSYNTSSSKSKSEKNNDHALATMNLAKNSSTPIKRMGNKQLESAKVNEAREDKKEETWKDSKSTKNANETPKQKKKSYNKDDSKRKSGRKESHVPANVNAGKHSSIPIKRKEDEQLKGAINKTVSIFNVNDPIAQTKSEKNKTREDKKKKIPKDSKSTKEMNESPKQRKNSYNKDASKGKSSRKEGHVPAGVNAGKYSGIPIKRKEGEQLSGATNKTTDISKLNKTANTSKKDKSVIKLKQNSGKVNETRKYKKEETPKDSKNTKNTNETPKQKKKSYNKDASEGKTSRKEDHIPARANAGKYSGIPVRRKEDEQLNAAINKTINISKANKTTNKSGKEESVIKLKQNSGKLNGTREAKKEETPNNSKNTRNSNKTPTLRKNNNSTIANKIKSSKNESHVSARVKVGKKTGIKQKTGEPLKSAVNKAENTSNVNKATIDSKNKKDEYAVKHNHLKINDTRKGKELETPKEDKGKQSKDDSTRTTKSKSDQNEDYVVLRSNVKDILGKRSKFKKDKKSKSKTAVQSKNKQDKVKINKTRAGKKNETLKGNNTKKSKKDKYNIPKQKTRSHNTRSSKHKSVQNNPHLSKTVSVRKYSEFRKRREREELKSRSKPVSKGIQKTFQNRKENKKDADIHKQGKGKVAKGSKKEQTIKLTHNKGGSKNDTISKKNSSKKLNKKMRKNQQNKRRKDFNKNNSPNITKSTNIANNVNTTLDDASTRVLNRINEFQRGRFGNVQNQTNNISKSTNNTFDLYASRNNTHERNLIQKRKNPLSNSTQFFKNQAQQSKRIQNETSKGRKNDNKHSPGSRKENETKKLNDDIKHDREIKAGSDDAFRKYNNSHKNYSLPYKPISNNEVLDDSEFRFPTRLKLKTEHFDHNNAKRYRNKFDEKYGKPIIKIWSYDGNVNGISKGKDRHKSSGKNGTITISRRVHNMSVTHSATTDIQNMSAKYPANKLKNELFERKPFDNLQYQKPTVIKFQNETEYNTTDISQTQLLNNGKLQGFNEKIVKTVHKSYIVTEVSSADEILPDDLQSLLDPEFLE